MSLLSICSDEKEVSAADLFYVAQIGCLAVARSSIRILLILGHLGSSQDTASDDYIVKGVSPFTDRCSCLKQQ